MNLQQQERQRVTDNLSQISQLSTRAPTVINQQQESLPFISYTTENVDRQQKQQEENERKQKLMAEARKLMVPTQESQIKSQLRQLGQPVTYFGESAADRRQRLRTLLTEHLMQYGRLPQFFKQQNNHNMGNLENEYFLYEGLEQLRAARIEIAKLSLHNAALRVEKLRLRRLTVDALQEDQEVLEELQKVNHFAIQMSQFGDSSGISRSTISPNQKYLATAGGSGECKLWDIETASLKSSLLGHLTKCHSIAFHPQSLLTLSPQSFANVATASADLSIRLWTLDLEQPEVENLGILQKSIVLKGHEDRINKVIFHQDGKRLISMGFDKTWRLWDIETQTELMVQTGHSRAIYSGTLHPDGSLLFTGDLGGFGMAWDLRIGKGILPFVGHVKGILASDFSMNGYHLATGGDDNFIRVWDIRRRNVIEKIPAHIKLVSDLKFQPIYSKFLISASYDGNIKFWNSRDWSLHSVYETSDTKHTSVCITNDIKTMISTGLDRKFVIWQ
ncbi:unnamed protein product [Paramecium octaurelia]|uniref:Pre-mRNA processing factor 4 (PRP4)-like domain-containing protein n=1 Tax=Paramecium octaurelia TaxID=43137 RepID=A0A8S1WV27_PAROT|nr:unnamed protein product [Paramecium octaurelia]